jgi:hypothetical protein
MEELKPKKPAARRRRVMKAANAPEPTGPVGGSMSDEPTGALCGHSDCTGGNCNVHYVGPTSHLRDHHIVHAARGISHVWSAAIITGLAIVITGAIAFTSAQAATTSAPSAGSADLRGIAQRLDRIEGILRTMGDKCTTAPKPNTGTLNNVPTSSGSVPPSCRNNCTAAYNTCATNASTTGDALTACIAERTACLAACQ